MPRLIPLAAALGSDDVARDQWLRWDATDPVTRIARGAEEAPRAEPVAGVSATQQATGDGEAAAPTTDWLLKAGTAIVAVDGRLVHADAAASELLCRAAASGLALPQLVAQVSGALEAAREHGSGAGGLECALPLVNGGCLGLRACILARPEGDELVLTLGLLAPRNEVFLAREACKLGLTPREQAVARLAVCGFANGEIARRLGVAPSTVKNQLASAYRRAGVGSRTELACLLLGGP